MENKRKNPCLRFRGFTEAWEQRKFCDFALRESNIRLSSYECPSVEYEDVVAEEGRLNKDVRLKETQKNGIVFEGTQVLYGKLRPYLHNWLNPNFTGVAVGDWWVLRPIGMNKKFLYRLIQTKKFDDVANQSSGSKMPRSDWNLVSNTEFIIPTVLDEQRLVAETFDSLDNLITLHQRKYDKLVAVKKSLLEKLFPADGELVPKIRFKGFTDAWEQRKLNELVNYSSSNLTAKDASEEGLYDLYDANNLIGRTDQEPIDIDYITIIKDGAGVGRIRKLPQNTMFIGTMGALTANKTDLDFIFAMLTRFNLGETFSGSTIPHIYFKDYGENKYFVPNFEEQRAIGEWFDKLDNLITLHQRKLRKLKQIKQAMLNKMFV